MENAAIRITILVLWSFFVAGQARAVNRCVDGKGKVSYQDSSCPGAAQTSPVDTTDAFTTKSKSVGVSGQTLGRGDPAYASAKGMWRGPAQFQYSVGGARDPGAQQVTPLVIELKETGEVAGVITDAGCKLSGLSTQFIAPHTANVDVTLKGCMDRRFNTRFSGQLAVHTSAKEAKLTLYAIRPGGLNGKVEIASLEAVLKR